MFHLQPPPVRLLPADDALRLWQRDAVVLDTRGLARFLAEGHIPRAIRVSWRLGTAGVAQDGRLAPPDVAAASYAAVGVDAERPILVVGEWERGWGEEGRVAWDLAYLGHPDVSVLIGGMHRWTGPRARLGATAPPGRFTAEPQAALRVDTPTLAAAVGREDTVVLDVRDAVEFAGATPHGEARGGHIPGALSVPWRELLPLAGGALPSGALAAAVADRDARVIATCTGGVRSGLAWALLCHANIASIANHDDGMWGWARSNGPVSRPATG